MTLISLHLPKTAGTSFRSSLMTHFGTRYRDDYKDQPMSKPSAERISAATSAAKVIAEQGLDGVDCIHGHFLPVKYLQLHQTNSLQFITWLRDPVARLLSQYTYWQESYDAKTSAPHHRQVIEQGWTLEQFCLSEQFRNIYTQYLSGFPFELFAFIGITEYYNEDYEEFAGHYLSPHVHPQRINTTNKGLQNRPDPTFLDHVREFHAADMELYHRALTLRQKRIDEDPARLPSR